MAEATDETIDESAFSGVKIGAVPIEVMLSYNTGASNLHQRLLSRLKARRLLSEREMNKRYDAWNRVDENCRMYIDLSRKAKNADGTTNQDKQEMPWSRAIVVPMSYAIQQVYLTQMMGIFTRRDPPLEIHGVGPEDVRPAKLMNAVIAYDQVQTNYTLELYTALKDGFSYGMGGFHDSWEEQYGWKTQRATGATLNILNMLGEPTSKRQWSRLRQFNRVKAFDPFQTWPDPRVSLSDLQRGEFFGHTVQMSYLDLLAGSQDNGGNYFNVEHVQRITARQRAMRARNRFASTNMSMMGSMDSKDHGFHHVDSFVISLVPREWELGAGDRPEKWQFTWVDDQVIIRAHPADYDHGEFNYSAMESNIDTHVFGNQGSIENLDGLQRMINWFYNSHIQNVMKHLNNRMIYAASYIEKFDVDNPDAGGHIRLTALGEQMALEGRLNIQQMIQQLDLQDMTTSMLQDIATQFDFAMRMSGAADQMMGRTTSEKRTLGEVQRVGHEGSARMAMHAAMMDVQGLRPLALRWAANRQQYTDEEMFLRVAGDLAVEFGGDRARIKPGDIAGNFDYGASTGPDPSDKEAAGATLERGLEMIGKNPAILQIPDKNGRLIDIHEVMKEIMRNGGIKNPDDMYRAAQDVMAGMTPGQPGGVQVLPDEQVAQQAQRGNLMPVQGGRMAA